MEKDSTNDSEADCSRPARVANTTHAFTKTNQLKQIPKSTGKAPKKTSYPYELRPVKVPDDSVLEVLDKADLLEFIRVEALLRSSEVHKLFEKFYEEEFEEWKKKLKKGGEFYFLHDSLFRTYGVVGGWLVIGGSHHTLLFPNVQTDKADQGYRGILDLFSLLNNHPPHMKALGQDLGPWLLNRIKSKDDRWLWLRIDTSYPPHVILKAIEKELTPRHKKIGPKPQDRIVVIESESAYSIVKPTYESPIRDFRAWIQYFKCYDLRNCEGLTYGQIATRIFGKRDPTLYALAKKSCKRAERLIAAAEANDWPPSIR